MTHSKRQPKIEWDHLDVSEFGGFRVTNNLEHFNPPADWVVDPGDSSHFLPRFKPCKYRRMSRGTIKGRPYAQIHCLLFEDIVDHLTCVDCEQCVAPSDLPVHPDTTMDNDHTLNIIDVHQDVDPIFDPHQQSSTYVTKVDQPQASKWPSCQHRSHMESNSGCGSCAKYVCQCVLCPLANTIVTKKDCTECQYKD